MPHRQVNAAPMMLMAGLALLLADAARAEESDEADGFLVLGATALPDYEGSDDLTVGPLIVSRFSLYGVDAEIEGLRARADLLDDPIWRAGPALGITLPRNDRLVDQDEVEALDDVELALELGGFVGIETPFGNLPEGRLRADLTLRQDVLGSHSGLLITPEIDYFFAVNFMFRVGLRASATWANDDYVDTYFSIDAQDSLVSGLDKFEGDAGFKDVGVEIYSILSFSPTWGVFTRFAYNRLLGDAADSPLVDDVGSADQYGFGGGVFYRF